MLQPAQSEIMEKQDSPSLSGNIFDQVFDAQKKAFFEHGTPGAKERRMHLKRLKKALIQNQDNVLDAIDKDFAGHRSKDESFEAEMFNSLHSLTYTAKRVKKWMKPSWKLPGLYFLPAIAKVHYQPLGVVGIISPWNYPLYLTIAPLAYALAAGNRVIIRMSKESSHLADLLKRIINDIFEKDQVALFTGQEVTGPEFTQKDFDHILFTGSTVSGKHVMRSCADHLTPVTLELGGKSPAIISKGVPMKDAARRIAWGKMLNSGQTCIAPDYVLCPEHRVDDFITNYKASIARMYPTLKNNPDYSGINNEQQYAKLQKIISDAQDKNARIIEINPANEDFSDVKKIAPKIVLNATDDMMILQEEIFGPLLPVITYQDIDEAINYVNKRPRPLALYYFDYNRKNIDNMLNKTYSGGVTVNDTLVHVAQENMPFGGVGMSGMGKYHGKEGFLTFSNAKGVLIKPRLNSGVLAYPPYDKIFHRIARLMFRNG